MLFGVLIFEGGGFKTFQVAEMYPRGREKRQALLQFFSIANVLAFVWWLGTNYATVVLSNLSVGAKLPRRELSLSNRDLLSAVAVTIFTMTITTLPTRITTITSRVTTLPE